MIDTERIEALIDDFESYVGDYPGKRIDWTVEIEPMRALIASWRERGELLREAREDLSDEYGKTDIYARIDAALKAKP